MRQLVIDGRLINDEQPCYVVAEIGTNHQGSLEKAKELFAAAKSCGADAVKLQKRDNRTLFTKAMYDQPYNSEHSFGQTYGAHREALEFGKAGFTTLQRYARELGITMFATPWDVSSADVLAALDLPAYKIASADLRNTPLLRHVARFGKPMLVSTGGGSEADVRRAYDAIIPINPQLAILQCTMSYPCEPEDLNLHVIETYRKLFPGVVIGFSDHQNGIAMAMIGYAFGARIVEKHFTLNRAWKGTDHAASLEPQGLFKLVRNLKATHLSLTYKKQELLPVEIVQREKLKYRSNKKNAEKTK